MFMLGVAGLYDYGPPGTALQSNLVSLWRQFFVVSEDMLELDLPSLTPHDVLKTSGHVDKFADWMVKDAETGEFFRADHFVEKELEKRVELGGWKEVKRREGKKLKVEKVKISDAEMEEYKSVLAAVNETWCVECNEWLMVGLD
jgi:glycyl-tRNA synthetase